MRSWNRREVLASWGWLGGAALWTGCRGHAPEEPRVSAEEIGPSAPPVRQTASPPASPLPDAATGPLPGVPQRWTYQPLDPATVGQLAYDIYPQGSCMYAVFGSVMSLLAEQVGEPFRSFPLEMMRYGATGIGGWGSTCGVVNGCAALIGLFHPEQGDKRREELISDLCLWYESSPLPQFQPTSAAAAQPVEMVEAGSILCHVSMNQWCQASGCDSFSAERRERCRRLSADGAVRVVQLLNADASGSPEFLDLTEATHACIRCHGKTDRRDASVKMSCHGCHQFDRTHP